MRYRLKGLFIFVTSLCLLLATGRYWVARGYVDEYETDWVPYVWSVLPILDAKVSLNGQEAAICGGSGYEIFGYDLARQGFDSLYFRTAQFGICPKTVIYDPDGRPYRFTQRDTAAIEVRTIFGWSRFEIRRVGDTVTIRQVN